jgi:DNA-directed RNA polymerase subunit RPC12/RpoP
MATILIDSTSKDTDYYSLTCPYCNASRLAELNEAVVAYPILVWADHQDYDNEIVPERFSAAGPIILHGEIASPRYICLDCKNQFDAFFADGSHEDDDYDTHCEEL